MTLFHRLATLLRADAHGVVDALEERSLLLRQHLRDAELELLQKRARIAALENEEARLREESERRAKRIASLEDDVQIALDGDQDELARFSIRRLLPERRDQQSAGEQTESVRSARNALAEKLADQERAFEALRDRARTELRRAPRPECAGAYAEPGVAEEEVDLELTRRRAAQGMA